MIRLLWVATIALAALGVLAAYGRTRFLDDYVTRMGPVREQVFRSLDRQDPSGTDRRALERDVDARFSSRPLLTLWHVIPGGLYLLLAPLQLSKRVRRNLTFHRWNGRLLIVAGLSSVLPGLYFGVVIPLAGPAEAVIVAIAGAVFMGALVRAYVAIRAKQVAVHREWMLRAFAAAIAISVVRVVAGPYDLWLSPLGWSTQAIFALSLWTGWGVSLGVAEWWIRRTRPAALTAT